MMTVTIVTILRTPSCCNLLLMRRKSICMTREVNLVGAEFT